jgi:hypothetical protein
MPCNAMINGNFAPLLKDGGKWIIYCRSLLSTLIVLSRSRDCANDECMIDNKMKLKKNLSLIFGMLC